VGWSDVKAAVAGGFHFFARWARDQQLAWLQGAMRCPNRFGGDVSVTSSVISTITGTKVLSVANWSAPRKRPDSRVAARER
jgi:hypothetical protein